MAKNNNGWILEIKIIPKAKSKQIIGWEGDVLKIKVTAAPEKGLANQQLIELLSDTVKVAKSRIEIISGETSRQKKILFTDCSKEEVIALINKTTQKS